MRKGDSEEEGKILSRKRLRGCMTGESVKIENWKMKAERQWKGNKIGKIKGKGKTRKESMGTGRRQGKKREREIGKGK
jgi:hypothetical protein